MSIIPVYPAHNEILYYPPQGEAIACISSSPWGVLKSFPLLGGVLKLSSPLRGGLRWGLSQALITHVPLWRGRRGRSPLLGKKMRYVPAQDVIYSEMTHG